MKKAHTWRNLNRIAGFSLVAAFFLAGTVTGCLSTEVKNKTSTGKLSFSATDTANANTFKFNFAYRSAGVKIAYLQGSSNTKTTMTSTCNSSGTNCVCELLDASNAIIETVQGAGSISYDSTGNYFRCAYVGADPTNLRLRNQASTKSSAIVPVETAATLTITKLMGDLSVSKVRGIYRYTCLQNYLNKEGTSAATGAFDCSNQATTCNTGATSNLCLLQTNYPYFLFSDFLSNNFNLRPVDHLYNTELGGKVCGLQLQQYDCTVTTSGTNGNTGPTVQLGAYSEQVGVFDTALSLVPAPNESTAVFGYVAQTSTFNATTVCPPGLVRQVFYKATPLQTSFSVPAPTVDSNYPTAGVTATEISSPTVTPASIQTTRLSGGACNGTSCSFNGVSDGVVGTTVYSSAAQIEFCAIPASLVP